MEKQEVTDIIPNLDEELNNFLSGLFQRHNIEINEELQYDFPLENDFANLLNQLEDYVSAVLKANNDIKKILIIEGIS